MPHLGRWKRSCFGHDDMSLLRWLGCSALAIALAATVGACHGSDASSPSAPSTPSSAADPQLVPRTFKVATWNIRSGKGIRGFTTTSWSSDTTNCTDHSQPVNAWGMGLTQAALGKVKDDQSVVALALQEAWFCGSPQNVQGRGGIQDSEQRPERHGIPGALRPLRGHEVPADRPQGQPVAHRRRCVPRPGMHRHDPDVLGPLRGYNGRRDPEPGAARDRHSGRAERTQALHGGPERLQDRHVESQRTVHRRGQLRAAAHYQHDRERGLYRRVEGDAELGRLDGDADPGRMRYPVG